MRGEAPLPPFSRSRFRSDPGRWLGWFLGWLGVSAPNQSARLLHAGHRRKLCRAGGSRSKKRACACMALVRAWGFSFVITTRGAPSLSNSHQPLKQLAPALETHTGLWSECVVRTCPLGHITPFVATCACSLVLQRGDERLRLRLDLLTPLPPLSCLSPFRRVVCVKACCAALLARRSRARPLPCPPFTVVLWVRRHAGLLRSLVSPSASSCN